MRPGHEERDGAGALLNGKVIRQQRLRGWVAAGFADADANAGEQHVPVRGGQPRHHRHHAPYRHRPSDDAHPQAAVREPCDGKSTHGVEDGEGQAREHPHLRVAGLQLLLDGLDEHAQDRAIHVVEEVHPHQHTEDVNPMPRGILPARGGVQRGGFTHPGNGSRAGDASAAWLLRTRQPTPRAIPGTGPYRGMIAPLVSAALAAFQDRSSPSRPRFPCPLAFAPLACGSLRMERTAGQLPRGCAAAAGAGRQGGTGIAGADRRRRPTTITRSGEKT